MIQSEKRLARFFSIPMIALPLNNNNEKMIPFETYFEFLSIKTKTVSCLARVEEVCNYDHREQKRQKKVSSWPKSI